MTPENLDQIIPLLVKGGAGALAWRALVDTPAGSHPAAASLKDLFEWQLLRSRIADAELTTLLRIAGEAQVELLLGKGWAVARLYPGDGSRTYGDFDVYVASTDHPRLEQAIRSWTGQRTFDVDLHRGASYLDDRPIDLLTARSSLVPVGSSAVRVFALEDLLRLACLHLLAEGAIRAIWLCDIAVMLSHAGASFDWRYFASGDPRQTEWAFAAIGLAHHVLDADVSAVPPHHLVTSPPTWLMRSVLETWGRGLPSKGARVPFAWSGSAGRSFLRALADRWPQPIEATIGVRGRINAIPRWPFQLAEAARRTAGFSLHAVLEARRRRERDSFTRG